MSLNTPLKLLAEYNLLTIIYLLPLLAAGYVQTTDMPWGPQIQLPNVSDNSYIFLAVLKILSFIVSSMIVQKLLLISIFVLAGIGAHRLTDMRFNVPKQPAVSYLASLLYTFNPFVYSRLLQGQWLVLCGYALLPWAIGSFYKLMLRPTSRQAVKASAWSIAVGLTSIHAVGFVLLAHVVIFAVVSVQDRMLIKKRLKYIALASVAWLAANALWLIPFLSGHSPTRGAISGFSHSQLQAFATVGTVHGSVPLSTILLEGFWPDPQGRYVLPSNLGWWWYIVVLAIGGLIVAGIVRVIKKRDALGISLLILAFIGWWLGMGIGSSWSAGTTNFLVAHLTLYRGYREPQKWLMLLALMYSYTAAVGLGWLLERLHRPAWAQRRQLVLGSALLLPLLYTPTLLWGAGGQLRSAPYPKDYATVAQTLNKDTSDYKVLVLPWHQYLPLSYAGRVVANPANHYFKQPMITGDNPEIIGVPPQGQSPLYKLINNQLLPDRFERTDIDAQLKPYNVQYVILLKEADWRDYGWLSHQTGLHKIQDGPTIRLYKLYTPQ